MTTPTRSMGTILLLLALVLAPGLPVVVCAQLCADCECEASHLSMPNPDGHEHESPCSGDSCRDCTHCLGIGAAFALPEEASPPAPPEFSLSVIIPDASAPALALCDIFHPPRA